FEYQPLDTTIASFRLIRVLPTRSADGHLRLKLWHDIVSVKPHREAKRPYRCLSYRWGDQTCRKPILLNGKLFFVGTNLHDFLEETFIWSRSPPNRSIFDEALWIDSICINQESVEERGHQVQRMERIYARARLVLVWLGKAT
ncbi:HET-domain-containing protein, partial [Setomelanomma holmii]